MESDPVDNDQIDEVNELESPGPITTGASIPVPEHAAVGDLSECPCCKRTFNPNALRKHVAFCGKKRKVFDSSRQRREGTALSTYVLPKNFGLPNAEKAAGLHTPPGVSRESSSIASGGSQQLPPTDAAASPASTRRKTNTDQARATARSSLKKAAGAATAETPGAAAAPPGLTRDRMRSSDRSISKRIKDTASERCPHCERSFNPKAFDRHVEWCKEKAIQANIKAANTVETNKAKERMEARKQYRPPNLKTKRSLNRDKYSGSIEEQQQYEAEMVAQKQTLMSLSAMTSSVQSDKSDSNASSKTSQSSNRSYKSMNSFDENTQKSLDDSQKREIFISIETEANAQGHSPISPQSLRHMVGNAQTPIDVLHIENGNEPEHAKFSKISDTEEDHLDAEIEDDARHVHYSKRSVLSSIPAPTLPLPNVRANNAKNEIEKRLGEFKQIGEEFGDSLRRNVLQHQEHVQQVLKCNSHLSPSPSGDSDELSSLDGYPMSSSQSSRRGASSKLSSDSAYGSSNSPNSLSQRSGDKQLHISNAQRSQKQLRPHTAGGALASSSGKPASRSNKSDASTQAQTNYGTLKARQQLYAGIGPSDGQAGYSSSCSEISLPVAQPQQQQQQNSNFNYHQQQQHQHQQQSQVETAYNNNNNNNNNNYEHNAQNNMNNNTINAASTALASSQHSLSSNTSNGSSSMTASMKMSNYCYECGSKFMIGHAKFCVECGVKRVAL